MLTNISCYVLINFGKKNADVAELADALDLGSSGRPCRFDSCHPHAGPESQI